MLRTWPPCLQPLGLEANIGCPVVHNLVSKVPAESINKIQNPMQLAQYLIQCTLRVIGERKMVNVDMEMDDVTIIVSVGKGMETTGKRVKAVEGKNFDKESESGSNWGIQNFGQSISWI
uniref:Uncharacterized protein n=1 Tax=Rhizophora mucronata TaxID=61149 RepID=A0A2P2QUJ9_RHIMU